MKILHTADWHLGQTFYQYDRKEEHTLFLNWLLKEISLNKIDVLLIAGDIFDSPNPSAQSQRMYYNFLYKVSSNNPNLQIIIIAGNHDSAARLEAPNPLLENFNITVRGIVNKDPEGNIDYSYLCIPLQKGGYCMAVPYLRQGDYPSANSYSEGVQLMYENLYNYLEKINTASKPVIAMGHLQASGSEISENDNSERTIIGGLECINPDSFSKGIRYTALGHLHRAQQVSHRENIRYAGSPIPMSFAERNNKQGVTIVTIEGSQTNIEKKEFEAPIKLLSIPAKPMGVDEVLNEISLLPDGQINQSSPYLEIKILITEPEPSLKFKIDQAIKDKSVRLARIVAFSKSKEESSNENSYQQIQTISPIEMANNIFKQKYGAEQMPGKMMELLQEVIREVDLENNQVKEK